MDREYPLIFRRDIYTDFILERDNYVCQNPACSNIDHLEKHHIDHDKYNCDTRNVILLCHVCHNRTNRLEEKEFWIKFYQQIMVAKYKKLSNYMKYKANYLMVLNDYLVAQERLKREYKIKLDKTK